MPEHNRSQRSEYSDQHDPPWSSRGRVTNDQSLADDHKIQKSAQKHVTTACLPCKERKAKCSGSIPCARCVPRNLNCVYPQNGDGRGQARLRQRVKDLERQNQALMHLVDELRYDHQVQSLDPPPYSTRDNYPPVHRNMLVVSNHNPWKARSDMYDLCQNTAEPQPNNSEIEPGPQNSDWRSRGFPYSSADYSEMLHDTTADARTQSSNSSKDLQRYIAPGAVRSFGNLSMSSAFLANGYPETFQTQQLRLFNSSYEYCLPLHIPATTASMSGHLSNAVQSFQQAARSMIASGGSVSEILSMEGLDLTLFFRDRQPSDPHTVSTAACELTKLWTSLSLPHRYAGTYVLYPLLRWLIMPCAETYSMMPSIIRPSLSQLLIPHPASVDVCPVPSTREAQLKFGGDWSDRLVEEPSLQRFNWPYGDEACIEDAVLFSGSEPVKTLSALFRRHVDDPANWSLSRKALTDYPYLEGLTLLHEA